LVRDEADEISVIPGTATSAFTRVHSPWIPGSLALLAPQNDNLDFFCSLLDQKVAF
jgi:hypothetical protein